MTVVIKCPKKTNFDSFMILETSKCPATHPWPYSNGEVCCAHGCDANGLEIGLHSWTCQERAYSWCPSSYCAHATEIPGKKSQFFARNFLTIVHT